MEVCRDFYKIFKMAQIILASSEIETTIDLIECIFPGVQLKAIKDVFNGISVTSDTTLTKQIGKETFTLNVKITK